MEKQREKIVTFLKTRGIEALLLTSKVSKAYVGALTGSGVHVLYFKEQWWHLLDGRYENEAKALENVFTCYVYPQGTSYLEVLQELLPIDTQLAVEGTAVNALEYQQLLKRSFKLTLLHQELTEIRSVKDDRELKKIQKSCDMTDQIFQAVLNEIQVGMTELQVAGLLYAHTLKVGASGMAFDPIIASGIRSAFPHGRPTDKVINQGDLVILDFGIVFDGYQSDLTRTISMGQPSSKMLEIYEIVKTAQQAGLDFIKTGVTGQAVDKHVRAIIEQAGYGAYFTHGLGHGLGLGNDSPLLNSRSMTVLEEGMVMTCEPGIYIPDYGGVRIEDDVAIIHGEAVVMSKITKELIIVGGQNEL